MKDAKYWGLGCGWPLLSGEDKARVKGLGGGGGGVKGNGTDNNADHLSLINPRHLVCRGTTLVPGWLPPSPNQQSGPTPTLAKPHTVVRD